MKFSTLFVSFASAIALTACGGGGGGTSPAPVTPPPSGGNGGGTPSGPTWTQGVFQAESTFQNKCVSPRSGTNPATGNAFLDAQGTLLEEQLYLRSWNNRTYLWYSEVADLNPAGYSTAQDYFDTLKTNATTTSGNARDRFHFYRNTAEYQQAVSSGSSASYGARFRIISGSPPRDIRIAYVQPGSPADTAGLKRGDKILKVDNVDAVNGGTQADVDVLNSALFPSGPAQTHTLEVEQVGGEVITVSVTSAIVTNDPVLVERTVSHEGKNVGYMLFNTFGTSIAEEALFDSFTRFSQAGVDELVLDLRYNGGGFLDISSELGYMIAGSDNTDGKVYETLQFNDKYPNTNPITGRVLSPSPFYSQARGFSVDSGTALPSLNLNKVYILSTASTCSASESLINGLRGVDVEVVLIGGQTCGKPYGFYGQDNCGTTYFTIQFRGINDKGFGDYADGFTPQLASETVPGEPVKGCPVGDDFSKPLGDTEEDMFANALTHIATGSCNAQAKTQAKMRWGVEIDQDKSADLLETPEAKERLFFEQMRILNDGAK